MALNPREEEFVEAMQNFADAAQALYSEAVKLSDQYTTEFADSQHNELAAHHAELTALGFGATDPSDKFKAAEGQFLTNFINFWTGAAVNTRAYGDDILPIARS